VTALVGSRPGSRILQARAQPASPGFQRLRGYSLWSASNTNSPTTTQFYRYAHAVAFVASTIQPCHIHMPATGNRVQPPLLAHGDTTPPDPSLRRSPPPPLDLNSILPHPTSSLVAPQILLPKTRDCPSLPSTSCTACPLSPFPSRPTTPFSNFTLAFCHPCLSALRPLSRSW